ncbi:MAG: type IV pilus secretin PilQ [Candidatus Aminicenantes bacterium]|nr:type IV pilus secretin PilQ [Candidatus Aminicenantes bacterium]
MRTKKLTSILIFFVLVAFFLNGKTVIKGVEYFKGDDFVQLHFATDSIIPIPDLFYPIEDNFKFIVMRIEDVTFEGKNEKYFFNSPVIKEIELKSREKNLDVEIKLKNKASYRVFSNRNGLYIEFPVLKVEPKIEIASLPGKKKVRSKPEINPKAEKIEKTTGFSGSGVLKNVSFEERKGSMLRFGIALSNKVNYKVIPLEETPARLAIDLHNVKSKKINKRIGLLNVKGIRGSYNSPKIFRIVFDLDYLKEYNVFYNGNTLEVEFNKKTLAKNKQVKNLVKSTPSDSEVMKKSVSKSVVIPINSIKDEAFIERLKKKGKVIEKSPEVSVIAKDKGAGTTVKLNSKPEFFTEEKSGIEKKDPENFIKIENDKGPSQIAYLKNTIEEGRREYTGTPMDFSFKNADLTNVLKFIAQVSNLNIVIDPGVTGRISSELKQVPWDQALELFLKINSLDMILEGNILRIGNVVKLAQEAEKRRKLQEARQMEGKLEVITRKLSYAKASDIKAVLSKQLSKRGEVVVDDRTNMLIISEVRDNVGTLDKLIDTLDSSNPQVSIEAKIVETSTSFIRSLGIQWGTNFIADSYHGNQTNLSFPNSVGIGGDVVTNQLNPGLPSNLAGGGYAVNVPASGAANSGIVFSLANAANTFQLTTALTAMESQGKGRLISAPKITTQDNMTAKIVQGARIPIQTTQNNTVTVRYENAALELEVTPHITAKGTIVMEVSIKNDYPDWGNTVLGNPQIITQEVVNTVTSNDGGTIVIGGIFKVDDSNSSDKVPFLSKIPIIGTLFKNSTKRREQKELLIFLTPRIVK